jgi:hypothetical protein
LLGLPRIPTPTLQTIGLYFEEFVRAYDQQLAYGTNCNYVAVGLPPYFQPGAAPDDYQQEGHQDEDGDQISSCAHKGRNSRFILITESTKQIREESIEHWDESKRICIEHSKILDDQESNNRLNHAERRTPYAHIQLIGALKIVAVFGPNIVQAVRHTISEHLSDAPMSELVEEIREIGNRNEEE